MTLTPFAKQFLVAGAPLLAAISVGGAVSYPTVLLHQLRNNESEIHLDFDTASWIGSVHGLAGLPSILLPTIMQWIGRKFSFIAACLFTFAGWITAYAAGRPASLLIAESFHGLGTNSILAVSFLSITEMLAPEYRHVFMQLYAILVIITMSLNGLLTQYLHWRTIAIVMSAPMIVAVLIATTWPESPYWLALKGKLGECEKSFIWLRGSDENSLKELRALLDSTKENLSNSRSTCKCTFKNIWATLKRRDFYLPVFHVFVLQFLFYWSGTLVVAIYAIDVIQTATNNDRLSQYGSLIMNMVMCAGVTLSIYLNKTFKKKPVLLCCTIIAAISMIGASISLHLQNQGVLSKQSYISSCFLISYMGANGIGIYPIAYALCIDLMPVKHRGLGGMLIIIFSCILHATSLKISPYLVLYVGFTGTFLIFAINCLCSGIIIWKYVPETKSRTLQEIEDIYNKKKIIKYAITEIDVIETMMEEMQILKMKELVT